MLPKNNEKEDDIPPKTKLLYEDFKLVAETSTYKVFNARTRDSREWHTVRVLDCTKEYAKTNDDHATTLFVQELLWLQCRYPGSVFTNTFEISENGKQMACATLSYLPLNCHINGTDEVIIPKDITVNDKLLSDVFSDVEFLWKDLQLRKFVDVLGPENIAFIKEKGNFFLGNWAKLYEKAHSGVNNLLITTDVSEEYNKKKSSSQELAIEIEKLRNLVEKLLSSDLQHSSNLAEEESKQLRVKTSSDFTEQSMKSIGNTLVSWLFSS